MGVFLYIHGNVFYLIELNNLKRFYICIWIVERFELIATTLKNAKTPVRAVSNLSHKSNF